MCNYMQTCIEHGLARRIQCTLYTEGALVPRYTQSEQASIAISLSNWQVSWTHTAQPCKCCALTNDLCS